jgi:hypothetical protein
LRDLPKVSLNEWYASEHWTKRKRLKDIYKLIVKNHFKHVFSKDKEYVAIYAFNFKQRPLDASNCVAMVKMIEDIVFEDDKWNIVRQITILSNKGKEDFVKITVDEI